MCFLFVKEAVFTCPLGQGQGGPRTVSLTTRRCSTGSLFGDRGAILTEGQEDKGGGREAVDGGDDQVGRRAVGDAAWARVGAGPSAVEKSAGVEVLTCGTLGNWDGLVGDADKPRSLAGMVEGL